VGMPSQLLERGRTSRRRAAVAEPTSRSASPRRILSDRHAERLGRIRGKLFGNLFNASASLSVGASITQTIVDAGVARHLRARSRLRCDGRGLPQTTLSAFSRSKQTGRVRILEQEAQEQRGRAVGRAIAPAVHQPLRGSGQLLQVITAQTVTSPISATRSTSFGGGWTPACCREGDWRRMGRGRAVERREVIARPRAFRPKERTRPSSINRDGRVITC